MDSDFYIVQLDVYSIGLVSIIQEIHAKKITLC